jgi:hypothetical protein
VRVLLAALMASLVLAGPAMADDTTAVGQGQVITDQATETEPAPAVGGDGSDVPYADDGTPAPEPAPDASGRRGEIHVLGSTTSSNAPPVSAPAPASAPAAAAAAPTAAKTLPFTGVNAGALALIGLALLGSGVLVRRAAGVA